MSALTPAGTAVAPIRVARLIRLARLAVWRQFLGWAGAWWFAFTLVLGQAVVPLLGMLVWMRVMPAGARIGPYYLAVTCVALWTASFENHTFAQGIYSGDISAELMRPQPAVIGPVGENLAIRMWMSLLGLPLVVGVALVAGVGYQWQHLALAVPAVLLAAVLRFLFTWTLAMSAFWTERVHAVVGFGDLLVILLGGSAAPLPLMPAGLREVANVLPFRAMLGWAAEVASGTTAGSELLVGYASAVLWICIFGLAAVVTWRAGIRRFTSVGG